MENALLEITRGRGKQPEALIIHILLVASKGFAGFMRQQYVHA